MVQGQETLNASRRRALRIFALLREQYPEARCTLRHENPFQLLVMTILAAQCTDARVNIVCKTLFAEYPDPAAFLAAEPALLEAAIRSTGFFRVKAKNILATSRILVEQYGGDVPRTMEALLELPGVGRKTANLLLGDCFDTPGVVVDTHCGRLARRMGFTRAVEPRKVELDLMRVWPRKLWADFSHLMVFHGRALCSARTPKCAQCVVRRQCPWPDLHKDSWHE